MSDHAHGTRYYLAEWYRGDGYMRAKED